MIPRTFGDWLQPKRRAYRRYGLACLMLALVVPLGAHWLAWRGAMPTVWSDHHPLVPWWLVAWLFPVAWAGVVAGVLLVFEALAYGVRMDRGDHSWSSMAWTLRAWRPGLVLLVVAAIATFAGMYLADALDRPELDDMPYDVLSLLLTLLIWNVANLSSPAPPSRWRSRWPGRLPFLLLMLVVALSLDPGPVQQIGESWPKGIQIVLVLFAVAVYWFLRLAAQVWWMSLARTSPVRSLRIAVQPRVFLPVLFQYARLGFFAVMLVIALLPLFVLLVEIIPLADPLMRCCDSVDPMVVASRFAVSYWWAVLLVVFGGIAAFPSELFLRVASARLLVELDVVRDEPIDRAEAAMTADRLESAA